MPKPVDTPLPSRPLRMSTSIIPPPPTNKLPSLSLRVVSYKKSRIKPPYIDNIVEGLRDNHQETYRQIQKRSPLLIQNRHQYFTRSKRKLLHLVQSTQTSQPSSA